MPQVRRSRKAPLDGCQLMEPMLDQLGQERREVEMEPHKGKKKLESLWPIFRIHHQKTIMNVTIIFSAKIPSPGFLSLEAEKPQRKRWKKQGCGNFCCLHCIQTWDTNSGKNCSCRVPKNKLEVGRIIECTRCDAEAALGEAFCHQTCFLNSERHLPPPQWTMSAITAAFSDGIFLYNN
uniref:Uncharacterized protein n=1 Tax=Serinus canaria TaxID=9135 RepID=A0A8C9NA46_SERCA